MRKAALGWIAFLCMGATYLKPANQEPATAAAPPASPQRAVFTKYCFTCHNEKLKTANLVLSTMDVENPTAQPEVWEKVISKLRTAAMPPAGMPRPDKATYDSLAGYLEKSLDQAAASKPNPGRPTDHRLNRAEYSNAIRDLLTLDIDAAALLPPDDSNFGFDNNGDVLSVSPLLMERYMLAAGKITKLAIGDPNARPGSDEYRLPETLMQDQRESEDLPFGSRGGLAVRHNFTADGDYVIRIRLQKNYDGFIRGINEPHQLDVRVDGARVKLFTIGGEHKGKSGPLFTRNDPDYRGDPAQVEYEMSGDEGLEVRFPAKAGTHLVQVAFLNETTQPEGILVPRMLLGDIQKYRGGDPVVDTVTVIGPYNPKGLAETASRRKIFVCSPAGKANGVPTRLISMASGNDNPAADDACAQKILTALAHRAYRRPATDLELQDLLRLYKMGRNESGFETGIAIALQRILAGPEFLFRTERDPANVPPGTAYRVSDPELASRLSFFLWSSIPDEQLLDAAEHGKLKDRAVLDQQVRRLLADPRSKAMVDNFAGQWLNIRNLRGSSPDSRVFPDFDDELRNAFRQETELFFESMLREDRPIMDLFNADYTYVNERLARHYGIPNVFGERFRRVTLSDEARKGLLGQGTILTVTSRVNRTSPVLRGKWVLENLLGAPPPPPPPNVPGLKDKTDDGKLLTMRQQMEQHRANPACAVCHSRMDPIGFSLDNFNGIGQWRTTDAGSPLDVSGVLYDGTKFQGPVELRKVLLDRREQVVHTITEKLLTYALGREVQYYDEPAVRAIVREAASGEYRWSALITSIVNSTPFEMRRSRDQ